MYQPSKKDSINRALTLTARIDRELADEIDYNKEAEISAALRECAQFVSKFHKLFENMLFAEMKREREND